MTKDQSQGYAGIMQDFVILLMEEIRLTTWDVKNPANNGIKYVSTGAGFLPSTAAGSQEL